MYNVRVIKENVDGARRKSIYELGLFKEFNEPVIVIMHPVKDILTIHGKDPLDKYINIDAIPDDMEVVRIASGINSGVVFTEPSTILVRIFCKRGDISFIQSTYMDCCIEILNKLGADIRISTHRLDSNDLVFFKDGHHPKKFCGTITSIRQSYFSFFISLKVNAEKIDGLYKLETDKFKSRGVVKKISDVIGGLTEILPNITEDIVMDILNLMAKRLTWNILPGEFTQEEQLLIKDKILSHS